jgi:hypothetical protein
MLITLSRLVSSIENDNLEFAVGQLDCIQALSQEWNIQLLKVTSYAEAQLYFNSQEE